MLSVIIVDYKSLKETVDYIERFMKSITPKDGINFIIVDNFNRGINNIAILKSLGFRTLKFERFDKYRYLISDIENYKLVYIQAGFNAGYAKGNNIGIRISKSLFDDDYYLISNNDIFIQKPIDLNSIYELFSKNSSMAVIGPKIVGIDGIPQSPNKIPDAFQNLVKKYFSMASHNFIKWKEDLDISSSSKYCYRVMGAFMFIRASAIWEIGLFDENTFMYAEEMILSERLKKQNYKTYYYNDMEVIHKHGMTVKKSASIIQATKWSFESEYYYYKKYRHTSLCLLILGIIVSRVYIVSYCVKNYVTKQLDIGHK